MELKLLNLNLQEEKKKIKIYKIYIFSDQKLLIIL